MKDITKLLHTKVCTDNANPAVTPIFQASAFEANSPFFYTRKNNPNIEEFEMVIASIEQSNFAIATSTGMAAISLCLNLLTTGDILVINKDIYGCSFKLFQKFCARFAIKLFILDLSKKENYSKIPLNTNMILFETPTNPFLKTINIKAVSDIVKKNNRSALVVVDNTWATPLFQKPLNFGADITIYSATKYFSGHSDVMGGVLLLNNESLYKSLLDLRFYTGCILAPYSAWLLRRSMQSFAIRMKAHQSTTRDIVSFLKNIPQITKVYYPAIDGKQLVGYGTLIFFDLRQDLVDYYHLFTEKLKLFSTGTGMACVTSMIAQPFTGSHASMNEEEKEKMGLSKNLIRFSFGLEDIDDLKTDILQAFDCIENVRSRKK